MNISILSPDGTHRSIPMSAAMQEHFSIPINHANTILTQINEGMYARWFKGKKDLVCMDFGANVGLVSLYMLPACKALLAVEPTPSHDKLLRELLRGVPHKGTDIAYASSALTGSEGEFQFATGHSTENKVTSSDGYGNNKITVSGHTLIWFIAQFLSGEASLSKHIDFCKIDIEGGEMMALTIEQLQLAKGIVKTFFVEVHPAFGGSLEGNANELVNRFETAGYTVERIDYQTIVASS